MIVLPAIDIQNGICVRLQKGDFATAHQVAESPLTTAQSFFADGAAWIHMVDLDGAKNGKMENASVFLEVAKKTGLMVELGGGIRDMETIEYYLQNGISRVILGSVALKDPVLVKQAVKTFGERIAVGIDARGGKVATEGWLNTSEVSYLSLAKEMEQAGVGCLIFTDIARDGMQQGVNLAELMKLHEAVSCKIVASGGVRDLQDIERCKGIGLYGAICGKAIYSGGLSLREAVKTAGRQKEDPAC